MADIYAIPCDVEWPDNNHSQCTKCDTYGRVPIIEANVNDLILQWTVGAVLVIVAGLAVLAVWVRR